MMLVIDCQILVKEVIKDPRMGFILTEVEKTPPYGAGQNSVFRPKRPK